MAPASGSIAAAAAKATPSTVDISVNLGRGTGEGSGVILTADGNVLTNNHVVAGAQGPITVTLADGSEHQATVVGTSPSYDLAVIKIQGVSGLTPATLGKSADLQVGQQVVAIGSPQGLTGTVTNGIVSAFNRTVAVQGEDGSSVVYNGMQTDAPINPGNSGGPLVEPRRAGRRHQLGHRHRQLAPRARAAASGWASRSRSTRPPAWRRRSCRTAPPPSRCSASRGSVSQQRRRLGGRQRRADRRRYRRARPRSRPGWPRATSSPRSATPRSRTSPT